MNSTPPPAPAVDIARLVSALEAFGNSQSVSGADAALESIAAVVGDTPADEIPSILSDPALEADDAEWAATVIRLAVEARKPIPILRTFAQAQPIRVLAGLAELSYVAGREGDDEVDWAIEAGEALIDAFGFEKVTWIDWLETAKDALHRAFLAGVAQREIDLSIMTPSSAALRVAKAQAVIYADEIDHPQDACPSAIDSAISRVAYKLAERQPITPAEAAYAAMLAFREEGLVPSLEVAEHALARAKAGYAERAAAEQDAREREAEARSAVLRVFGGEE